MEHLMGIIVAAVMAFLLACTVLVGRAVVRSIIKATPKSVTCYEHHGNQVFVQNHLKGKHREHCLCFSCDDFHPGTKLNCAIAKTLYQLCIDQGMVTPVYECPKFKPIK